MFFGFPACQLYGHNPLMFQGITAIARWRNELTIYHGYEPLKSQRHAGDLTLSILSIFDERRPSER